MVVTGGCSCGSVTWSFEGEPLVSAVCHCDMCKRSTGSICSLNFIVPAENFRETLGKAKTYTSKRPSGNDGTSHFCESCGSPLYVTSAAAPGVVILKAGTVDDLSALQSKHRPTVEMFCDNKLGFVPPFRDAQALPGGLN